MRIAFIPQQQLPTRRNETLVFRRGRAGDLKAATVVSGRDIFERGDAANKILPLCYSRMPLSPPWYRVTDHTVSAQQIIAGSL